MQVLFRPIFFSFLILFFASLVSAQTENNGLMVDPNSSEMDPEERKEQMEAYGVFKSGWAMVRQNQLNGFKNRKGKIVVPIIYSQIHHFGTHKKKWAMVGRGGKFGFINTKGIEIVPCKYDAIEQFGEIKSNWAVVVNNGLFGVIDKKGREILPPIYKQIKFFGADEKRLIQVINPAGEKLHFDRKGNRFELN